MSNHENASIRTRQHRSDGFNRSLLKSIPLLNGVAAAIVVALLACISGGFAQTESQSKEDVGKVELTAKDIREMNATSIVEILNRVPGVEAGETYAKIRGSYDVKVVLDGRPLNDPLSKHSSVRWNMVSLNNVERIEIFKGSGAVAFGDGTSGGAIRITSKKIGGNRGKVKAEGGSFNTQLFNANYGRQMGPFGFDISTDYFTTDSYRVNQDRERLRLGVKADYQPQENISYNFSADYAEDENGNAGYPSSPTPHSRANAKSLNPAVEIIHGRFQNNLHLGIYNQQDTDPDQKLDSRVDGWSVGDDLSFGFATGILKSFNAGLAFNTDSISGNYIANYHEERYGVSLTRKISLAKNRFSAALGLRANLYSAFDSAINPEMRLTYNASRRTSLQFSLTRTNNTPRLLQRFYQTSTMRANPNLGMEKATNVGFSTSYHPQKSFDAAVTFFYSNIADRITYVRDHYGPSGTYLNFGRVTRRGIDLNIEWKPYSWLAIKPSHQFLVAKDVQTNLRMVGSPDHHTQISINCQPFSGFTAVLIPEYWTKQYTRSDNKEYAAGHGLLEIRADYAIRRWRLYGRIKNFTNKSYFYGDGLPAPPRSWIAGMSREF
jgi:vitamin B12 transporter